MGKPLVFFVWDRFKVCVNLQADIKQNQFGGFSWEEEMKVRKRNAGEN